MNHLERCELYASSAPIKATRTSTRQRSAGRWVNPTTPSTMLKHENKRNSETTL
jgi:hypothetical protein